jgi:hypothetical protein
VPNQNIAKSQFSQSGELTTKMAAVEIDNIPKSKAMLDDCLIAFMLEQKEETYLNFLIIPN